MLTAITLTVLAILCRVASPILHTWNFVPMGAVALYAGARLPRRWAWLVPVSAFVLSDIILDYGTSRPQLSRWAIYLTIGLTSLLGPIANLPKVGRWLLPVLSVGGSVLFFLVSNLATWAEGLLYPVTVQGLVACYVAAIPFFGSTIAADLLGTAVLFGLGPVFERAALKSTRPGKGEMPGEL